MISVKQILYWTQLHRRSIIAKARNVGIRVVKVSYVTEPDGEKYKKVEVEALGETGTYDIVMFFHGKGLTSKIWCSCSCPYFCFHVEKALSLSGSTDINFSNGKMPKITNPRLVKHTCKHCVAALQRGVFMLEPLKAKQQMKKPVLKRKV